MYEQQNIENQNYRDISLNKKLYFFSINFQKIFIRLYVIGKFYVPLQNFFNDEIFKHS